MPDGDRETTGRGDEARSRPHRVLSACCRLLVSLSLFFFAGGCNLLGAAAAKLGPPPTIPAQYTPAPEPTLLLVENYHNPASMRLESEAVTRVLSEELTNHQVVPLIDPSEWARLRQAKGAAYRKMPLDAIGQALGAAQVIYVDLEQFEVDRAAAGEMYEGRADAVVRVVDTADGSVLWPTDTAGGYPISVRLPPQRTNPALGDQPVRQQLHASLADRIARLFYPWQSEGADTGEHNFGQ
jgi:hypothetical protein